MKAICSKFLTVGFMALSSQLTYANELENSTIKADISHYVNNIIDKQISKGYLTEKATISITISPSVQTHLKQLEAIYKPDKPFVEGINISTNARATLVFGNKTFAKMPTTGKCDISLVYDDQGGVEALTDDVNTLIKTELQNLEQKKIAQQFIALHEQFHCEFNKISIPVLIDSDNIEFNKQVSYIFRDQKSPFNEPITYLDILNENFADTSAAMALIQQYGKNNENLLYVLNSLETQRHNKYYTNNEGVHFTHFSLEEVLEEKRLNLISNNLTPSEFQQLALTISNKGVLQVLANRPILAERVFSTDNIVRGVFVNILAIITYENSPLEKKKNIYNNIWGDNVPQGLAVDIAKDLLKNEATNHVQFFDNQGNIKNSSTLFAYINNLISHKKMNDNLIANFQQSQNIIKSMSANINSSEKSSLDYINTNLSTNSIDLKKQIVLERFIASKENIRKKSSINLSDIYKPSLLKK